MALTPELRSTQAQVVAVGEAEASPEMRASQAQVIAIYNYPSQDLRASQAQVIATITADLTMRVQQAQVVAVVRGRIDDYELRAWWFPLDGHNFYVLKLGRQGTVVYDTATGQWADWSTLGIPFWRLMTGMAWLGMGRATYGRDSYMTNIVAGDDVYGRIWVLDPTQGYDEAPLETTDDVDMRRVVIGQLPMRNRDVADCPAVYVTGSLGRPAVAGAEITLSTSDDEGQTWFDHGTIAATPGAYNQEFGWRSLGQIRAPGRMFRLIDNGAMQRIDGMDMPGGQ